MDTARPTIKKSAFVIILIIALFFDIPELILTVFDLSVWLIPVFELAKLLAVFVAPLPLFLALRLSGVKMTWKDALVFLGAGIVKGIPVANGLPTWTAAVIKIAGPLVAKDVLKDVGGKIPLGAGNKLQKAVDMAQNASKGNFREAVRDIRDISQKEETSARNIDSLPLANIQNSDTKPKVDGMTPKQKDL